MSIIEKAQLENGFWEKTVNGYRLTGKSLVPPALASDEPAGKGLGTWLAAGIVGFLAVAGSGAFFYRRRHRPAKPLHAGKKVPVLAGQRRTG